MPSPLIAQAMNIKCRRTLCGFGGFWIAFQACMPVPPAWKHLARAVAVGAIVRPGASDHLAAQGIAAARKEAESIAMQVKSSV